MTTDSTPPAGAPSPRERRYKWVLGALIASLVVNFFTLGAAGVFAYQGARIPFKVGKLVDSVPEAAQDALRERFRARRREMRQFRRAMHQEASRVIVSLADILEEEPFDDARASRILRESEERLLEEARPLARGGWDDVVEVLGGLPQGERREIAEGLREFAVFLEERRSRRDRRHRRRDRDD